MYLNTPKSIYVRKNKGNYKRIDKYTNVYKYYSTLTISINFISFDQ